MKESDLKNKILKTISRGDPDKKGVYYTVATVSEYLKVDFDFAYRDHRMFPKFQRLLLALLELCISCIVTLSLLTVRAHRKPNV